MEQKLKKIASVQMNAILVARNLMFSLCVISFLSNCGLSVFPSKTTVTYGEDRSTAEKDAKNDVLTDTEKTSWQIKQEFKWNRE